MMRLLLALLLSIPLMAANYRSIQGATGKYGTTDVPNAAPWNSRTTVRIEFRLHDWTATGRIFQWGGFLCSKNASDIACTNFYDAGSPTVTASIPSGATDVIVRVQRNTLMWALEIWRADGSERTTTNFVATSGTFSFAGDDLWMLHNGSGGSTGVPAGLAWFRVYSTAATFDSAMPTNIAGGDLLDYEFEGNGTDAASGLTMALTGSPSYPSTPVVPMVGEPVSIRSGQTFTPTCAGTDADSYKWRQYGAAPLAVTFSSTTAAAPTITGIGAFGQYSVSCEATINGVSGISTLIVGAVGTNAAGVVIVPDATTNALLGPMLRNSVSEWTWGDRTRRDQGDYWNTTTANYTNNFTSTEAQNYYDACLAQYQNYYRTGFSRFLTYGRACSDKFYSQYWSARATAGTCGENWIAPRDASFTSLALRAYETGEVAGGLMWTCLTAYANYHFDLWVEQRGIDNGYTSPYFGVREAGYSFIHAVAIAVAHPTSGVRTAYAARVTTEVTNYARGLQCQTGSTFNACLDNYTTGAGTITLTNGSATVTGSGTAFLSAFANGEMLVAADFVTDTNYRLTVSNRASDTSLTLSAPYAGTTTSGMSYAKNTSANSVIGNWRWDDPSTDLIGFGSLDWHSGILLEGLMRAHAAGIATSTVATVVTDFSAYLLASARTYPASTCTGSFNNVQARRTVYSVYYGAGDQGLGCGSDGDLRDQRQQNSLVIAPTGFAYFLNGTAGALTRGDEMWSATSGSWTGTGADGGTGLGQSTASNGKFYGQSFRNLSYLVYRLGSSAAATTAVPLSVSVGFRLADVATATKVRVTLTKPDGSTSVNTCTSSPCTVTPDSTQGNRATVVLEYLNVSDVRLASGQAQAVLIQ